MKSNSFVLHSTLLIKYHFFTVTLENCCCIVIDMILELFFGRWKPVSVCMQSSHEESKALMTDAWWRVSSTESLRSVACAVTNTTSDSHPLVVVVGLFPYLCAPFLQGLLVPWGRLYAVFSPSGKRKNFSTLCALSTFLYLVVPHKAVSHSHFPPRL